MTNTTLSISANSKTVAARPGSIRQWLLLSSLLLPQALIAASGLPNHIFSRNGDKETSVLVDKSSRSAYLVDLEQDTPLLIRSFDHLLFGENNGDKLREGDKKTPEGVYRVTHYIPDDKLPPLYGSGAFPLDYPNSLDRIEGRNGSGIWLHGRDDADPKKEVTRGCVAFNNNQIGELTRILAPNSPVIITQKTEFISPDEYKQQRDQLFSLFDRFISNWQKNEIEQLGELVHADFHSPTGLNREQWIARKQQLASSYPRKTIETKNLYAFKENGNQVVFDYTQYYCADNVLSRGKKRLYFKRENGQLRLITEAFEPLPSDNFTNERVEDFLQQWIDSWQAADLERYLKHYGADFADGNGRDLEAYARYKQGVFSQRPNQQVAIDRMQIKALQADRYQVSFRQQYSSSDYSDQGIKTLILRGCPGEFQIVSEKWRRLR